MEIMLGFIGVIVAVVLMVGIIRAAVNPIVNELKALRADVNAQTVALLRESSKAIRKPGEAPMARGAIGQDRASLLHEAESAVRLPAKVKAKENT